MAGLKSIDDSAWLGKNGSPQTSNALTQPLIPTGTYTRQSLFLIDLLDTAQLDNQYLRFHADKARRILERGDKCCMTAPEAVDGVIELLDELYVYKFHTSVIIPDPRNQQSPALIKYTLFRVSYLPQRYPTLFKRTTKGISNLLTGETFDTTTRPLPQDPLITCSRLIQDDIALMYEKADGQYYLLAGSILLAGFWRLSDKFGQPLSEIHTSGSVPQFQTKLERGMMNFFRRLKPSDPVLRNNYFLQVDEDLAWSRSIGDEDDAQVSWATAEKNKAIEHHWFRSERQSLRRLPKSGAVVFTIRTYFMPVVEIAKEPGVPGRLASAVRSWGDDVARYKGRERYGDVLLEYLDRMHQDQVEKGQVGTMEEEKETVNYPF
ncbi:alpha-1,2-mannosyltransferase [Blastomyces silverae]|uniref:Alpha-1,2-mannosyltransferase n=1 Tax=Blastomyces silverae TaxID=2060906 RepID=A0A0H1BEC6_9EURO|nr:alpha-1,2-mannosyltransferase [Blastomyces silverae]